MSNSSFRVCNRTISKENPNDSRRNAMKSSIILAPKELPEPVSESKIVHLDEDLLEPEEPE